jgi:hypothetical protein
MNQDYLADLIQKIAPYEGLWESVRISGLAIHARGCWISLSVRILLSEQPPEQWSISVPDQDFLYFAGSHPFAVFGQIAEEALVSGYLALQASGAPPGTPARIFLTRKQSGPAQDTAPPPSWSQVAFQERETCKQFYGISRSCFALTAQGDRLIDLLAYETRRRIDGKLRLGNPGFDGISDLALKLSAPGLDPDSGNSVFEIIARLPFDLECLEAGKLVLKAPSTTPDGALAVRFFFEPKQVPIPPAYVLRRENAETCEPAALVWRPDVPWPSGSRRAKARLFFRDAEIDSIDVNRWPGGANLRAALDDHLDPGHAHLRSVVLAADKLDATGFETGVARLLSLVGVPVVWYGKVPGKALPDLAGCVEAPRVKVIVLGECTLEKPEAKFSGLAARAKELQDKFAGEAEVLPVVFTRTMTTPSEKQHAVEHGLALAGHEELKQLLKLLESPAAGPESAIEFLRRLQHIWSPLLGLEDLPRWGSRWT